MAGQATPLGFDELEGIFEKVKNWGRWGAEDERGALNLITPEKRASAMSLATRGITVSCALPLATTAPMGATAPVSHYMIRAGDIEGATGSADYFAIASHGISITHLDALCHIFNKGKIYNGRPASVVTSAGSLASSIEAGEDGIVSRGVLLDIPRYLGRDWLEPGEAIYVDELEGAEAAQGVRVSEGDILLINTGRHLRRAALSIDAFGGDLAGLHASCLPWLHDRGVALLGCDGVSDVTPSGASAPYGLPIHSIAIPGIGLHLLDNADFRALATTCADLGTWEFLLAVAPLRLPRGTASPVNPIALF